jgi:hypothetical protein
MAEWKRTKLSPTDFLLEVRSGYFVVCDRHYHWRYYYTKITRFPGQQLPGKDAESEWGWEPNENIGTEGTVKLGQCNCGKVYNGAAFNEERTSKPPETKLYFDEDAMPYADGTVRRRVRDVVAAWHNARPHNVDVELTSSYAGWPRGQKGPLFDYFQISGNGEVFMRVGFGLVGEWLTIVPAFLLKLCAKTDVEMFIIDHGPVCDEGRKFALQYTSMWEVWEALRAGRRFSWMAWVWKRLRMPGPLENVDLVACVIGNPFTKPEEKNEQRTGGFFAT